MVEARLIVGRIKNWNHHWADIQSYRPVLFRSICPPFDSCFNFGEMGLQLRQYVFVHVPVSKYLIGSFRTVMVQVQNFDRGKGTTARLKAKCGSHVFHFTTYFKPCELYNTAFANLTTVFFSYSTHFAVYSCYLKITDYLTQFEVRQSLIKRLHLWI